MIKLHVVFLTVVMGAACIYASYPYMIPVSEKILHKVIEKSKKQVDRPANPSYPIGSFEYEQKRTI